MRNLPSLFEGKCADADIIVRYTPEMAFKHNRLKDDVFQRSQQTKDAEESYRKTQEDLGSWDSQNWRRIGVAMRLIDDWPMLQEGG